MAHTHNIPLLVCVETYKMHERVQLDSICFNELGIKNMSCAVSFLESYIPACKSFCYMCHLPNEWERSCRVHKVIDTSQTPDLCW